MPVKKENKLHQIYSSSMFEDSNIDNIDNINNNKREIKYCNSNSFKISSDNDDKKEKKDNNNKTNNSIDNSNNEPSFIGDNNSYHRIYEKSLIRIRNQARKKAKITLIMKAISQKVITIIEIYLIIIAIIIINVQIYSIIILSIKLIKQKIQKYINYYQGIILSMYLREIFTIIKPKNSSTKIQI